MSIDEIKEKFMAIDKIVNVEIENIPLHQK
jgi:hypothetical protein